VKTQYQETINEEETSGKKFLTISMSILLMVEVRDNLMV
jgi:hypothetical protein